MQTEFKYQFRDQAEFKAVQRHHVRRTAATTAWFLTPHLRPGMSLLDCGCGPGTITVGLAETVAPGEVVGIDLDPMQLASARMLAGERGLTSVRFEVGDVYSLPFPDGCFDAAFTAHVLEHLRDPLKALREMRRVLKPAGLIGVCDPDTSTLRLEPETAFTREFVRLFRQWREQIGSPYYAPKLRRLLREAGFGRCQVSTFTDCISTPEATRTLAEGLASLLRSPSLVTLVTESGWADQRKLDELAAGAQAWGEDPDALWTAMEFGVVGWAN